MADPVFAMKLLGDGVAIDPLQSNIYAPCSGKVSAVLSAGHAIGITSERGDEILIHLGIDTSRLDKKHIRLFCRQNDFVAKGDLIGRFEYHSLPAGVAATVVMVITNLAGHEHLEKQVDCNVLAGETIIEIKQGN